MLESYRKVLVTGGAGFVGSYLVEAVLEEDKEVVILDDLSTGLRNNVPDGLRLLQADVSDYDAVRKAMDGVDLVFHAAAQPLSGASMDRPLLDCRSNALGTLTVLVAALDAGVRRVVYTSSSAAYGEPMALPMHEEQLPRPSAPYGVSKLAGEHYALTFARSYGLPCVCLRPFNVYGERENPETTQDEVFRYTRAILAGERIPVSGDGTQTRDFVHAGDVATAHLLAADSEDAVGQVFNVGTGGETSINALIEMIETLTGRRAVTTHQMWSSSDIYREYADTQKADLTLRFTAEVALQDGIRELARSLSS
ncbi:MAG: NAD-dependent epimerase/dehydratase family protein [Chloroflexota bacterium]